MRVLIQGPCMVADSLRVLLRSVSRPNRCIRPIRITQRSRDAFLTTEVIDGLAAQDAYQVRFQGAFCLLPSVRGFPEGQQRLLGQIFGHGEVAGNAHGGKPQELPEPFPVDILKPCPRSKAPRCRRSTRATEIGSEPQRSAVDWDTISESRASGQFSDGRSALSTTMISTGAFFGSSLRPSWLLRTVNSDGNAP